MKKLFAVIAVLFALVALSACSSLGDMVTPKPVDYSSEEVIGSALGNEVLVSELSAAVYATTVNSIILPEFEDTKTALSLCGDAVLNHLITTEYSRFSGNTAVLTEAAEKYPNMNISSAIGASDYEGALYKYFDHGGNIRHESTARFKYLSKISAYTPLAGAQANAFTLDIVSLDETESTYRMDFYCTDGENISPEYLAVFVKREGKTAYLASLKKVASEKVSFVIPEVLS